MSDNVNKNKITIKAPAVSYGTVKYEYQVSGPWKKYFKAESCQIVYSFGAEGIPDGVLMVPFLGTVLPFAWIADADVEAVYCDRAFAASMAELKEALTEKYPAFAGGSALSVVHDVKTPERETGGAVFIYEGTGDLEADIRTAGEEAPVIGLLVGTNVSTKDAYRIKKIRAEADMFNEKSGSVRLDAMSGLPEMASPDALFADLQIGEEAAILSLCRCISRAAQMLPLAFRENADRLILGAPEEFLSFLDRIRTGKTSVHAFAAPGNRNDEEAEAADAETAAEADEGPDPLPLKEGPEPDSGDNAEKTGPLVSVVVPVYNEEKYLRECLDSVLSQTYQSFEVLCVDDGSTDSSPEILSEYAAKDKRVTVMRQENSGLSASRNNALKVAKGEYICFVDSDDYIEPDYFEKLVCRMEEDSLDVCLFMIRPFISPEETDPAMEEEYRRLSTFYKRYHSYDGTVTGPEIMHRMMKNGEYLMAVWNYFSRLSYIRDSGNLFYEGILHEDNLFTFVHLMGAERVGYYPEYFYNRRIAGGSIVTSGRTFRNVEGLFRCFVGMNDYVREKELDPSAEETALMAMSRCLSSVRSTYAGLDDAEEKKKYQELSPVEQFYFRVMVLENGDVKVAQLEQERKENRAALRSLRNEKSAIASEKASLASQNAALKESLDKVSDELKNTEQANARLIDELIDSNYSKFRLTEKNEKLAAENENLSEKLAELEEE